MTSTMRPASAVTITCPNRTSTSSAASPSRDRTRPLNASGSTRSDDLRDLSVLATPLLRHVFALNHLLKSNYSVQKRLRPGRAAGNINIYRKDLVDALRHRVR